MCIDAFKVMLTLERRCASTYHLIRLSEGTLRDSSAPNLHLDVVHSLAAPVASALITSLWMFG